VKYADEEKYPNFFDINVEALTDLLTRYGEEEDMAQGVFYDPVLSSDVNEAAGETSGVATLLRPNSQGIPGNGRDGFDREAH